MNTKILTPENAKIMGDSALAFLATDVSLLSQFLAQTGTGPDHIRTHQNDPEFLGSVLDFILQNDETVTAFADHAGVSPDMVAIARYHLPGAMIRM